MATFYISTTGNDTTGNGSLATPWKSLKKATTSVTTIGDIIHVLPGTYSETQQCDLAKGVSLEGENKDTTIIKSNLTGDWSNLLSLDSPAGTDGAQSISGITFDGQYVNEGNFKTWWGIHVSGRSNVIIHDCIIKGFYDRGVNFDGNKVFNPLTDPGNYATGNKFYNNTLTNTARNTAGYGAGMLNIGGQDGMEIYNNSMIQDQRANGLNGWPIKYWENGWLKGCKITNNILKKKAFTGNYQGDGDWDFAIELFNIRGLEIGYNTIQGSIDLNYNYKGAYSYSVWIHHNNIENSGSNVRMQSGIIFEFATQTAIVEDNVISNASHAILFNARTPGNSGGYLYAAPTGGYSALTDNIFRRNLIYNIYNTYDNGFCCGGVGLQVYLEFETNDPYIRNLDIYNNTFVVKSGATTANALDFSYFTDNAASVIGINVRNNIFVGFSGPYLVGSNPTHASNVVLTHNNAYLCGNSNLPSWPGGNPSGYTVGNNTTANPLFVGGINYTLQSTSTMIDTGINIGLPFNGAAPDRGYAEYLSTGNTSPIANAGPDQTITLPTNSVTMAGSSSDPDGTIISNVWTKISGPATFTITNPNSLTTTITGLVQGVYVFRLTVTDNSAAITTDDIQVTVNPAVVPNVPPVVSAGPDQSITLPTSSATMAGTATDSDGTISTRLWTVISGPNVPTITTPSSLTTTVTGLIQGVYVLRLTATDNSGASTSDDMQITINANAANIPPVVNAGADQMYNPTVTAPLNGIAVDPDGSIVSHVWTKISGPTSYSIVDPTAYSTTVTGLVGGTYKFRLTVTDNKGLSASDDVVIVVKKN